VLTDERTVDVPGSGRRLVRITRAPVLDGKGDPLYLLSVIDDITEQRAAELSLNQAQKMEAIANLTGGVAHDFNNLLLVMIGNLDLLVEEIADRPSAAEKVEAVLHASLRGRELVQQMLAFARRQPLQPKPLDVNCVVRKTAQLLKCSLGERVSLRVDLSGVALTACVDEAQLQAALVNIAINARDAMPEGGVLLIRTRYVNEDGHTPAVAAGDYAVIDVADTGSGIGEDVLGHIFEPFFTTKENGKGTGLGLSMVYGFIQQSGGTVTVTSTQEDGTLFTLYLPCTQSPVEVAPLALSSYAGGRQRETAILVVDDNDEARAIVLKQARALGYTTREAASGTAALALIEQDESIKVLLTDIMMPETDGDQLVRLACARRADLKVLLMSGFPESRARSGKASDSQILIKPFRKSELEAALVTLFHESAQAA
jgi:signal transduction histidine kinase/ActR/RegA family two-component response regulator